MFFLILLCCIPSLNWAITLLIWVTVSLLEIMRCIPESNLVGQLYHTVGLLTFFNFVLVLLHYVATYNTHSLLFLYPNFDVFSVLIIPNDWHLRQLKKSIVARFGDSITTYDPSIGGILLGNNNKSDNPYFFFMNPFLSFKTRVFFPGEKLESYSYVLISLIFVYYVVSHSAYIFLYFLSNSKLFDSLLGKGWWYTSSVTMVMLLECI